MPVDINQFMQTLNKYNGVAKTNHFLVEISTPPVISSLAASSTLSLLCKATQLPGIQIGTDDSIIPHGYGVTQKMPWGVVFSDIELSFFGDGKGVVHNILTEWINSVVMFNNQSASAATDTGQPFFVSYKQNYSTTITIKMLDVMKRAIIEYTLYDCFPVALYDIRGDWNTENNMVVFDTRFTFSRWTVKHTQLTSEEQISATGIVRQVDSSLGLKTYNPDISNAVNEFNNKSVSRVNTQTVRSLADAYNRASSQLGSRDYFNA